jgi:hypothetical protein
MRQQTHACAKLDLRTYSTERADLDIVSKARATGDVRQRIDTRHV